MSNMETPLEMQEKMHLEQISTKFGISENGGPALHAASPLRRSHPGAPHSTFGTCLKGMQRAARALTRKAEATVRVFRHSIAAARLSIVQVPVSM
jgi:hypothetical protein